MIEVNGAEVRPYDPMEYFNAEFERCSPWLQAALDYSGLETHTLEDVKRGILEQRFMFWGAQDGCAVTEIIHYPRCRHFHGFLYGGNINTLIAMEDSFIRYAQAMGCNALTMSGRAGWGRALAGLGYEPKLTTVVKKIDILDPVKRDQEAL